MPMRKNRCPICSRNRKLLYLILNLPFYFIFQIVICQNNSKNQGIIQGILTHEMIHMYDYCNNKVDFKNIDHLACTEIRAANLTHCSYLSSLFQGDVGLFSIKAKHQVNFCMCVNFCESEGSLQHFSCM